MKHFIGTRFNLKAKGWKTTKSGRQVLSDEWLKNRFHLFEQYCLPSVRNQSNQNFVWCVFFDIDTPKNYIEKINLISKDFINFKPFYIKDMQILNKVFIEYIYEHLNVTDQYVITTRIDNDDLIHRDFVKTIQRLYKPNDLTVIDLKNGFQMTLNSSNPLILLFKQNFNPFISLIESVEDIKSVYSKMHIDWMNSENIISYEKKRLWIELIHEENKHNETRYFLKSALVFDKNDFGLFKDFSYNINILNVLMTNFRIDIKSYLKAIKRNGKYLLKLPLRTVRYVVKKIDLK